MKNKVIDHTECEECNDDYLFKMKDKYHEFYMPLRSILECLWMAEKEGIIPEIDVSWWNKVENRYN